MKKKLQKLLAGMLAAGCLLAGGAAAFGAEAAAKQEEPAVFTFESRDLEGNPVDESIFAGHRLTMINIWATFCGPCIREMPELAELAAEYAEDGVQIMGIISDVQQKKDGSYDEKIVKQAREIIEKTGAGYPHVCASQNLSDSLLRYVMAVPTTVFVDGNGIPVAGSVFIGSRSKADWAGILDGILKQMETTES